MKKEIKIGKYDNGQIRFEHPKLNGKLHGTAKWWWYGNGKPDAQISFVKDQRHGTAKWWWYSGPLCLFKVYQQGDETLEISFSKSKEYKPTQKVMFSKSQFKQLCQKKLE